jgi:hypothetical protein
VRKAWAENVVSKIADPSLRVAVLKGIADIMYTRDGKKGLNVVTHAEEKFQEFKIQFPALKDFMDYFERQWVGHMSMWVTGFRNIPHAGQDTNVVVESYHANMKSPTTQWMQNGLVDFPPNRRCPHTLLVCCSIQTVQVHHKKECGAGCC